MAAKSNRRTVQDKPAVRNNFRELAVWCYQYNFNNISPMTVPPIHSQIPFSKGPAGSGNKKWQADYCGFKPVYRPPVQMFKLNSQPNSSTQSVQQNVPSAAVHERSKRKVACWARNYASTTGGASSVAGGGCKETQGCRLFSHHASVAEMLQMYREQFVYPRNSVTKSEQRLLDRTISEVASRRRQQHQSYSGGTAGKNQRTQATANPIVKRQLPPARVKMKPTPLPKLEGGETVEGEADEVKATAVVPQRPRVSVRRKLHPDGGRRSVLRKKPPPKRLLPITVVTLGLETPPGYLYEPESAGSHFFKLQRLHLPHMMQYGL